MEDTTLCIKIENKHPVELNQLTASLNALSLQYDSYLRKSDCFNYAKSERKLYISKLEQGSVIIELVAAIIPLINDVNSIIEFYNYMKSSIEYFLGKSEKTYSYNKQDLEQQHVFLNQTSKDSGSNVFIYINGDMNNSYNINSMEANAAQNTIKSLLESEKENQKMFTKELMYWANASFIKNTKLNDKVIISNIDKAPKKVVFLNDRDRDIATKYNSSFPGKSWQDLAYYVDVEVSYIEDVIKAYKIHRLYESDIFDPTET